MSAPKDSERIRFQRKRVPVALHSELTEYSSLLRALRTNDALDITSQLTRYFNNKGKEQAQTYKDDEDDKEDIELQDGNYENTAYEHVEEEASESEAGPSHRTTSSTENFARRRTSRSQSLVTEETVSTKKSPSTHEIWTRWPLLARDVPTPEWTLQDEVAHITAFLLREKAPSSTDLESDSGSDPDTDSSISHLISSLTLSSSRYLDSILATLAAIIPERPASMINRLAPAGWQSVLAAAQIQAASQTSRTVSIKTLERVQRRLEDLYGSSSAPPRIVTPPSMRAVNAETITSEERVVSPSQPYSSSPNIPSSPSNVPISIPSMLTFNSSLSNHRIQMLHASSSKVSTAFSSYGVSPSDLRSFNFGYPGIRSFLPEGWIKDWYTNLAQKKREQKKQKEKEERKKLRKEKELLKSQIPETETSIKLRRSNRKGKGKRIDFKEVPEDANTYEDDDESRGICILADEDQHENKNGDGDSQIDDIPNVDEGREEAGHTASKRGRKRKRTDEGDDGDGDSNSVVRDGSKYDRIPPTPKRKQVMDTRKSQTLRSKPKLETDYKSVDFIVDSD